MEQNQQDAVPFGIIAFPDGYRYEPTYHFPQRVVFDWFTYEFPLWAAIAVGATVQQQILIQADSDFELRRIAVHFTLAEAAFVSAAVPYSNISALITDSGSGRNLMNNPVPLDMIASLPGQSPRDLTWPKIFIRNSTITVALTNFDAAATPLVRLSFQGRKIFPLGPGA